jgi:hypothetical protein
MKEGAPRREQGNKINGLRAALAALAIAGVGPAERVQTAPEAPAISHSFSERETAARELAENGITNYQRATYQGDLSDALARGWYPVGYRGADGGTFIEAGLSVVVGTVVDNNTRMLERVREQESFGEVSGTREQQADHAESNMRHRLDAWYMYLGIPQRFNTFGISDFRPSNSQDDQYYYRINSFVEDVAKEEAAAHPGSTRSPYEVLSDLITEKGNGQTAVVYDRYSGVMGNFTLSRGEDERGRYIAYWDRWDLGESPEGEQGLIGRPFEEYDRIYE